MKHSLKYYTPAILLILFLTNFLFAQDQKAIGVNHFNQGNFKEAIKTFEGIVKKDKKNAEVWNYLGLAYIKTNEIKEARKAFQKSIKYAPTNPVYKANLAYVYLVKGKYKKAQKQSNEAIKLDSNNSNSYYFRGISYLYEGKFEKAVEDAEKAISVKPTFTNAYTLKSDALLHIFGVKWGEGEKEPDDLEPLNNALLILEKCLKKCEGNSSYLNHKIEGIQVFYNYFKSRLNGINAEPIAKNKNITPIKVLTKPRPGYTDEARNAGTKGKIKIAVLFGASGKVEYTLIFQGLPNGLNEKALAAAKKINFVPMKKDGKPVSVVKVVQYNFNVR